MATSTSAPWTRKGHSTVSSYLVTDGAQQVIDFMTEVLQATTVVNVPKDDNSGVLHACLKIGDTAVMLQDPDATNSAAQAWLYVYVEDVDKTYALALQKGAVSVKEPHDECYGDRMGAVKDSAGNTWWIATQKFIAKCADSGNSAQ